MSRISRISHPCTHLLHPPLQLSFRDSCDNPVTTPPFQHRISVTLPLSQQIISSGCDSRNVLLMYVWIYYFCSYVWMYYFYGYVWIYYFYSYVWMYYLYNYVWMYYFYIISTQSCRNKVSIISTYSILM